NEDDVDVFLAVNLLKSLVIDVGSLLFRDSINVPLSLLVARARRAGAARGGCWRRLAGRLGGRCGFTGLLACLLDGLGCGGLLACFRLGGRLSLGVRLGVGLLLRGRRGSSNRKHLGLWLGSRSIATNAQNFGASLLCQHG